MFKTVLTSFFHPENELCLLAKKLDWESLEKEFAPLYSKERRSKAQANLYILNP